MRVVALVVSLLFVATASAERSQQELADIALRGGTDRLDGGYAASLLHDPDLLEQVALHSRSPDARAQATRLVTNQTLLASIAQRDRDPGVRGMAAYRLNDQQLLERLAEGDPDSDVRATAARRVTDATKLKALALNSKDPKVRLAAMERVDDPATWQQAALRESDTDVQLSIAKRTLDESVLANLAARTTDARVGCPAVVRVLDEAAMHRIARESRSATTRGLAWLSLLINDPAIKDKAPQLSLKCAAKDVEQDYQRRGTPFRWVDRRESGESIEVTLLQRDAVILHRKYTTDFPATLTGNERPPPVHVDLSTFVQAIFEQTRLDSDALDTFLHRHYWRDIRLVAISQSQNATLLSRLAQNASDDQEVRKAAKRRVKELTGK